jgi:hypothetical protein
MEDSSPDRSGARLRGAPAAWLAGRVAGWVPGLLAVAVWALFVIAAVALRGRLSHIALSASAQTLSLAVGGTAVVALAGWIAWRALGERGAGVSLGILGGWVSFTVLTVLSGTPYGIGGLVGDCGRSAAAAERFTTTWTSADQFLINTPSQYPPLYFWLWGRSAALRGVGAWQIMGLWQGMALGLAVVFTGLAWRLASPTWTRALGATALSSGVLLVGQSGMPCKTYEAASYLIAAPVLLYASTSVANVVRRGSLRASTAVAWGLAVGLLFTLYQLPILFGLPPALVLWAVWAVRARAIRAVSGHLVIAGLAAFLVSAWYVVPLVHALVTQHPGARQPDLLMVVTSLQTQSGIPVQLGMVAAVVLVAGFVLALWRLPSRRAQTIVALVVGASLIQVFSYLNVVRDGETFYSYRVGTWLCGVLAGSVALYFRPHALMHAVGSLARGPRPGSAGGRVRPYPRQRWVASAAVLMIALPSVFGFWQGAHAPIVPLETLQPGYKGTGATSLAYRTPLPDCRPPRGTPSSITLLVCYPATAVARCVTREYGPSAQPIVLAEDRASVFAPYYQVLTSNSAATGPLDQWAQRLAWVKSLAAVSDPTAFARQAASGPFGPVKVFVLRLHVGNSLTWAAQGYYTKDQITFSRTQFPESAWLLCTAAHYLIAVSRS